MSIKRLTKASNYDIIKVQKDKRGKPKNDKNNYNLLNTTSYLCNT